MPTERAARRRREDDRILVIAGGFFVAMGLARYAWDHSERFDVILSGLPVVLGVAILMFGLVRLVRGSP